MKASDLKGRAVVTLADAAKVGQVDDVLFDAAFRQVLGFRVKKGTFGHTDAVTRANVSAVGADALTVPSPEVINAEDRFAELAGAATTSQAHGTKVVTEGGDLLGAIVELELDDEARTVLTYTLDAPLLDKLRHRVPSFNATQVLRLGEGGIMIVPDALAAQVQPAGERYTRTP